MSFNGLRRCRGETHARGKRRFISSGLLVVLIGCAGLAAEAQVPLPEISQLPNELPELEMQTMGGRLFWGDVYFYRDWKIQQNVFTKHYRLLNGQDVRKASGTYEDCLQTLGKIRTEQQLEPMSGKAVFLIHGIIRSSRSFDRMKKRLIREGYQVFGFNYPSTRVPITDSASYLQRALESLEGIEEIDFVVHSMGGLVVRCYLMNCDQPDPRVRRMVMMGVPNQGAGIADRVKGWPFYKAIYGPAGQQLVTDSEGLISRLPVPEFEFGILSGARGNSKGYNPLIPGDDDGTVELEHTKLPGASDFITVPALHSFLMTHKTAIQYTVNFLQTGQFRPEQAPHPLPLAEKSAKETASQ